MFVIEDDYFCFVFIKSQAVEMAIFVTYIKHFIKPMTCGTLWFCDFSTGKRTHKQCNNQCLIFINLEVIHLSTYYTILEIDHHLV